jgi:hypothetical protein
MTDENVGKKGRVWLEEGRNVFKLLDGEGARL